ncbi:HD-GYP domain-containing protein [Bacillus sp. Marseille-P3661]|uniref:HD-GYP domain-containing protein n=1 Tax=Bacillus sp. Marseille-P3661 TaxID=1936234 RepID=UPI000C867EAB|nr:HD-GYP domain-containing protein [Bacillus sp. Marseille-P3661]
MTIKYEIINADKQRRNPILKILCIISLVFGIWLDFIIYYNQETISAAYVPFLIMSGLLSRYLITNIIVSGLVASLVYIASVDHFGLEIFILRWAGYFLISFVIWILLKNNQKDKENIINMTIAMATSLDARDNYTAFHSENVAYYSHEIGKAMSLSKKQCDHLYLGGLLHDIGKIGISENILNKTTKLTSEEYEQIKKHPQMGYDMLKHVAYFKKNSILEMVLHHHERFDGTGYPHGLIGENIPLVARIMAVADAFDAMTSKRIYRDPKDIENALNQLSLGKRSQFDPEIADVFLELVKNKKIAIPGINGDSKTINVLKKIGTS